jgi:hypothetical protein
LHSKRAAFGKKGLWDFNEFVDWDWTDGAAVVTQVHCCLGLVDRLVLRGHGGDDITAMRRDDDTTMSFLKDETMDTAAMSVLGKS